MKSSRWTTPIAFVAVVAWTAVAFTPAVADEASADEKSEAAIKILLENDQVQVRQTTWAPGQIRPAIAIGRRVVYVVKGGTLLRTYPDGKTKEIVFKTGSAMWFDESNNSTTAYTLKNVGTSEVVLYTVILK
ncbi:hypothetical protein BZM26_37090 [Paraburkholderia strydomiana]|nr:hypothetical protein BZM26_37090 [Paraburkholderia strydomiana]